MRDRDDEFLQGVIRQCLEILKGVHQKGICHRDIKPQHVIFSNNQPYLIDFGNAGEPGSDTYVVTPLYASATVDYVLPNYQCDVESLWYSFLALRQELPWRGVTNSYEMMTLKFNHSPDRMVKTFPVLAAPFLGIMN
eukprot:TRINITY_DN3054_c1_g1_i7.p1 TRINITY_DN3054_c1_g1~~TRINITY_DN3054_c1_g1_i7.p1  ORF type:complete len:137 (+),score=24.12 TRINITY_DN3054_c1_g1_i7:509-919(+)